MPEQNPPASPNPSEPGSDGPDATMLPSGGPGAGLESTRRDRRSSLVIRPARSMYASEVMALFRDGSLSGEVGDVMQARDLEDLETHYLGRNDAWLWVVEGEPGEPALLGMVAVREVGDDVAELRRLRVHANHRKQGIGRALVEHALQHCRERAFLKVVLDTFVERHAAIKLFEQSGFRHARSREADRRAVMDFYLDLYSEARNDGNPSTTNKTG